MDGASFLLSKSPIRIFLVAHPNQKYTGKKILGNLIQPEQSGHMTKPSDHLFPLLLAQWAHFFPIYNGHTYKVAITARIETMYRLNNMTFHLPRIPGLVLATAEYLTCEQETNAELPM